MTKNELKISFFGSFSNADKNSKAGLAPYTTTEITFFSTETYKNCKHIKILQLSMLALSC